MNKILEVKNLKLDIQIGPNTLHAVRGVDFDVYNMDALGIVGESGSGKSVTMKAIMGLNPENVKTSGEILFHETNLTNITDRDWEKIRGNRIAIVSQNPSSNLNPIIKIGKQMYDVIKARENETKLNAKEYLKKQSKILGINLRKSSEDEIKEKVISTDIPNNKKGLYYEEIIMQKSIILQKIDRKIIKSKALKLLEQVGIDNPEMRYNQYAFELSGGMKQRVVIAIALSGNPEIVIFDEPTTALDVTIQNEILLLIKKLQRELGFAIIFITHNLAVISKIVKRVLVMYAGKILEEGSVEQVISNPIHPYTKALFNAVPTINRKKKLYSIPGFAPSLYEVEDIDHFAYRNENALEIDFMKEPPLFEVEPGHKARTWLAHELAPKNIEKISKSEDKPSRHIGREKILEIKNLSKEFYSRFGIVHALRNVDLDVYQGEILAVVGESGSGKSTLAKIITGLECQNEGKIVFEEKQFSSLKGKKWNFDFEQRKKIQMIFQDSHSALNPRLTIKEIISEGLLLTKKYSKEEIDEKIDQVLKQVDLQSDILDRYPSMLSGGQRQRVQIARCLVNEPSILIADEPVSDLDVSIQANIINLFDKLRKVNGLTIILIAHDLSLVQYIADRVAVFYCGRLVEYGFSDDVFDKPLHPYTKVLIDSVPDFNYNEQLKNIKRPPYELIISGEYIEYDNHHLVFEPKK